MKTCRCCVLVLFCFLTAGLRAQTGTALVRHAPSVNGTVDGSLQQMTGESVTLNGGAVVTRDLLVPGTPTVRLNGSPHYSGTIDSSGSTSPAGYQVTLNGSSTLRNVVRRMNPVALPAVSAPPSPAGTRTVTINSAGDSPGSFTTLRNLTLNGNVGQFAIPAGTYGDFTANGGSGFTLGVAGATTPSVYNFQHLTFNGLTQIQVIGPVVITVANGFTANGAVGSSTQPSWLTLNVYSAGFTLNGGCNFYGYVNAPNGTVIVNGNSQLTGGVTCDRLTVNGSGLLRLASASSANHAPVANNQSVSLLEDGSVVVTLAATDADGNALSYSIVSSPSHGAVSAVTPGAGNTATVTYTPVANYNLSDSFTFKANDGQADSNPATVTLNIQPVNDRPVAGSTSLNVDEDIPATVVLAGSDVDGDALTFNVTVPPTHGTLSPGTGATRTYVSDVNYSGPDSFSYVASDGSQTSAAAIVTINVHPVNDAPVALDRSYSVREGHTLAITVTGTDVDSPSLTFAKLSSPANGTLTGTAPNFVYQPNPGFSGNDSFTFTAFDGQLISVPGTISIHVADNAAPTANAGSATIDEDATPTFTLTGSDPESDSLTFLVVTPPQHGSLSTPIPISGSSAHITYTPELNYNGHDSFTFKVRDAMLADSNVATFSITLTPKNDAPVADAQSVQTDEDVPAEIFLSGSDIDNPAFTFAVVTQPQHGSLSPITDAPGNTGKITYTPEANYNGPDSFSFKTNDGQADSAAAVVTITVKAVNDAPVAVAPAPATTPEDTPVVITLTATDVDSASLTFAVGAPQHGTLSPITPGPGNSAQVIYTPALNYNGPDDFTFTASDGDKDSEPATVSLNVTPVNDPPVATSGPTLFVAQGASIDFTLNATDADGDTLTYTIVTDVSHGVRTGTAPNFTYTPFASYHGDDSLTFTVSDGQVTTAPVTVNFSVSQTSHAPVAASAPVTTLNEDDTATITLTATDQDGDFLYYSIVTQPTHGTLSPPVDGPGNTVKVTYTPASNYHGSDSFTFKANDGSLDSNIATIPLEMLPVNDSPTAAAITASTVEGVPVAISLTATDVDGDPLTYTIVSGPANGSVSPGTGALRTYTPAANFNGFDSFTYKVNDGTVDSAVATVSINVASVDDAPVAAAQSVQTDEDTEVTVTLSATDIDSSSLAFSVVTGPAHGTLSPLMPLTGTTAKIAYKPAADYNGPDSFTFRVYDGEKYSAGATISLTVRPVNDAPVANPLSVYAGTASPTAIVLTGSDIDSPNFTFAVVTPPQHGTLSAIVPGPGNTATITYTSAPDFAGFDSFTIAANDGTLSSAPATVQLLSGLPPRFHTYTTTQDFESGTVDSVSTDTPNQISSKIVLSNYDVVWVANSSKGTVAKLDAETGRVLGEYQAAPSSVLAPYPSRIAVDSKGNAWVANYSHNSIIKIGLAEQGAGNDRNGDGVVTTSKSQGDILPWAGADSIDSAQDEAILLYVRTSSVVRHISIDANDDIWVSAPGQGWEKFDGRTGLPIQFRGGVDQGGNGGFMSADGRIFSAGGDFLIWDTHGAVVPLPQGATVRRDTWASALDSHGNLWCTRDGTPTVAKYSPSGELLGEFEHGAPWAMGIAIDANDHVWVAHSHCGATVGHLLPNGQLVGTVPVAAHGPVNVSIDRRGRIWVTSSTGVVERINPRAGLFGSDGTTRVGEVDLRSSNLGGALWTYGRFTGSTSGLSAPDGIWTAVYDGVLAGSTWGSMAWSGLITNDSKIEVTAALSADGINFSAFQPITLSNPTPSGAGRFLKTRVRLVSSSTGETPILYDLTLGTTGYTPPTSARSWSISAGADITGSWPDVIQLKGAFSHSVYAFPSEPTYAWSVVSGLGTVSFDDATLLRPKVQFGAAGTYVLRLTATLGAETSEAVVKLVLTPYNRAPYTNAGYTTFVATFPPEIWLWGEVKDDGLPLGAAVTSTWEKLFGPPGVTFLNAGSAATKASFATPGVYTLRLSASDTQLSSENTTDVWIGVAAPPAVPPGLVSWWAASANGDDHISGNQAFLERGVDYTTGKLGGAFRFNGSNGRVRVFASPGLDMAQRDGITVELWANPGAIRMATLVQYGEGAASGFQVRQKNSAVEVNFRDADNTNHILTTGNVLTVGAWTHITASYDRASQEARIFIDGILQVLEKIGPVNLATKFDFYLGERADTTEPYLGLLDEISVYSRAIYADEVTTIVTVGKRPPVANLAPVVTVDEKIFSQHINVPVTLNGTVTDDGQPINGALTSTWSKLSGPGSANFANAANPNTTVSFSSSGTYLLQLQADDGAFQTSRTLEVVVDPLYAYEPDTSLAAWWQGNGSDLDSLHGHKMERFHGTKFVEGKVSQAFSFDGVNDAARARAHPDLDIGLAGQGITVEFWFQALNTGGPDSPLFAWMNGSTEAVSASIVFNQLKLFWQLRDTGGVVHDGGTTGQILTYGQMNHVAFTYDPATQLSRIFLNGVQVSEQSVGSFIPKTDGDLWMASRPDNRNHRGLLDEFSLYRRALAPAEIAAIYAAGVIGKSPPDDNAPPVVSAGPDIVLPSVSATANLMGSVTDDGKPLVGTLAIHWSKVDGPGGVSFGNQNTDKTTAMFTVSGIYLLRLDANDGLNQARGDTVLVRVNGPTGTYLKPPAGMAAWWPGNGEPHEIVHGGHDVELGFKAGYAPAKVSEGFSQDGVSDFLKVAAHSDLDIGAAGQGITIECWFQDRTTGGGDYPLFAWMNGGTVGVTGGLANNQLRLTWSLRDTAGVNHDGGTTAQILTYKTLNHVAFTYDPVTKLSRIFLNGVQQSEIVTESFTPKTDGDLWLGSSPSNRIHDGTIDEFTLYKRALTPAEIAAIYGAGTSGKSTPDDNAPPTVAAGPDLVLPGIASTATLAGAVVDDAKPFGPAAILWKKENGPAEVHFGNENIASTTATFDAPGIYLLRLTASENYTLPVSDLMEVRVGGGFLKPASGLAAWWPGNGEPHEIVHGGHDVELGFKAGYAPAKVSEGFSQDGVSDFLKVAAHSDLDIGSAGQGITIECWFKDQNTGGPDYPLFAWMNGGTVGVTGGLTFNQLKLTWSLRDTAGVNHDGGTTGQILTYQTMNHVAFTYDPLTRLSRIFLNGVLQSEIVAGLFTPKTDGDLWMGSRPDNRAHNGTIDEFTLYKRALTPAEIAAIYNAGVKGKSVPDDNAPPSVDAGPDIVLSGIGTAANLVGTIVDDAKPFGPATVLWKKENGPTEPHFGNENVASTTVTFDAPGIYLLRLTASENYTLPVSDLMEVRVGNNFVAAPAGLAAWWPGNGEPHEIVHGGHDVELGFKAGYAPAKVSEGFSQDGVSDFLKVAAHSDLDIGSAGQGITIECWFQDQNTGGPDYPLFAWMNGGTVGVTGGLTFNQLKLTWSLRDTAGVDHNGGTTGQILTYKMMNHVAFTYDPVTRLSRIFLNGVLQSEIVTESFTPKTDGDLWLGSRPDNRAHNGTIDEFTLYKRALTPAEIVAIYNAGGFGKARSTDNTAPYISAGPDKFGLVGAALSLAGASHDDGLPNPPAAVTYQWSKVSGPGGVTFSAPTALSTTATFDALGSYVLRLSATDSALTSTDDMQATITAPGGQPPTATITAPLNNASVNANSTVTLAANASDPDGTVSKVEFFDGATKLGEDLTAPYSLTLTSGFAAGSHTLTAKATDNNGNTGTSAAVSITVVPPASQPPVIVIIDPPPSVLVNSYFEIAANVTDPDGVITKVEFFQGATKLGQQTLQAQDEPNVYFWSMDVGLPAGTYVFTVKATDNTGVSTTSAPYMVEVSANPTDHSAIFIDTPSDSARIAAPTAVKGVVAPLGLTSWRLQYRLRPPGDDTSTSSEPWLNAATGTAAVGDPGFGATPATVGTLGTFDPTSLLNGIYEMRLSVNAGASVTTTAPITVVVDGNMKIGTFTLAFEDLKLPLAGMPITITRTYDSRDPRVGDFGPGWRLALSNVRVQKNRNLGVNWRQTDPPTGTVPFFHYFVTPQVERIVTVTMPDGETHRFRAGAYVRNSALSTADNDSVDAPAITGKFLFYPLGDTTSKLEPLDNSNQLQDTFFIGGTGVQTLTIDDPSVGESGATFNTSRFRLTTKDGTVMILDEVRGLLSMIDLNGNTLTVAPDAVTSTQNTPGGPITRSVSIHRDATGRVDYIRDPAGKDLDYAYDPQGRLATFANRENNITQFRYENVSFPYYLTKIIDPRGITALRTEFDANGKMFKQIDADGKETVFTHGTDPANRFEKIKDRLGNESTFFYDDRGNVTLKIDPLGAQTTYSYHPDSDWVKFETDHYGNVKSIARDAKGNITVQTMGANAAEDPASPTTGHITRTTYNDFSAPTQIVDPDGRAQALSYDPVSNRLLTHTKGAGGPAPATAIFTYNADGTIATITDALGDVTSSTYNYAFSDPTYPGAVKQITVTVTDPAGSAGSDPTNPTATVLRVSRMLYDSQENQIAQIATRTLPNGTSEDIVTRYLCDTENRLVATVMPDGRVTEARYTSFGKADKAVLWRTLADYQAHNDANARVTSYGYDARGNLNSVTYPDGTSESMHFDEENRKDWSQDRRGNKTYFEYDKAGRPTATIAPDGTPGDLSDNPRTKTVYDLIGRVTDSYDELGHRTQIVYFLDGSPDAMRRQQEVQVRALGNLVTTYAYDQAGNVRFVTDPRGNTVETRYDDQSRPRFVIYPATDEHPVTQTETRYDVLGRRIATIDLEGKTTRFRYNGLGHVVEVRQYLNNAVAASDSDYSLPATHSSVLSTRYSFDELGNPRTQTDSLGRITSYETDNLGRRTKRVLPKDPSEGTFLTEQGQYDEWGNLWKLTDFAGKTTTFAYDSLDRLKSKNADPTHPSLLYPHAIARVEYDYDAEGMRGAARTYNASSTLLYTETTPHDERDRLRYKDSTAGHLSYSYYANDLLKDVVSASPGNSLNVGYRYDESNRLESVDDASSGTTRTTGYSYNANGALETLTQANAVVHTYSYDSLNRLRALVVSRGPSLLHTYEYKLNPSGHRRQVIEGTRTTNYTYDNLYRLTDETIAAAADPGQAGTVGYTLDKVGNRLSRLSSVPAVSNQNNGFNARDWLDSDTYTSNGSTVTGHVAPLAPGLPSETSGTDVYDFEEHLILRTRPDLSTINISYDGDGHRTQKTILNAAAQAVSTTSYLVDTNNLTGYAQVVEEKISAAGPAPSSAFKTYTYGDGLISANTTRDALLTTRYFAFDGHNNVRELTDETGAVTDRYDYDAYGKLVSRTGTTDNAYLHCGEQFDADLGLYFLRARYLNPDSGRFWSADNFEGFGDDPQSLHRYNYANANPVAGYDPSGNMCLLDMAMTVVVIGTVSAIAYPVVRPVVAQVVSFLGGDPNARYSLSSLGVYDESEDLLEALGLSPDDFSANLLAEAFVELGTDAIVGAISGGVGKGFAAFRRSSPLCFAAGTRVSTTHGDVNIEDIKEGDSVCAFDFNSGKSVERKVTEKLTNFTYVWVDIHVGGDTVAATRGHLFWVESQKGWVAADDLQAGMSVRFQDGEIETISGITLSELQRPETTYNLVVEKDHNYFVGAFHVLVHNGSEALPPPGRGNAPIGDDGFPMELHHKGQRPNGRLQEKTRTDHRLGENFKKNHPNTGQKPSKIDRAEFKKTQRSYWKREWDKGRWKPGC